MELHHTREALVCASNLAERMTSRANTAEAAEASANAKHQELIVKYSNLVAKWCSFVQYPCRCLAFIFSLYADWNISRPAPLELPSNPASSSAVPIQKSALEREFSPGGESCTVRHLNIAMHSVRRSQSLLEGTY